MTQTDAEDRRLRGAVDGAVDLLSDIPELLHPAEDTHYVMHDEYAERAVSLARYLDSAVSAIRASQYAPGYALLRAGLEHHLVDHLLLLAKWYLIQGPLPLDTFEQWVADWEAGAPGTENIVELTRNEGGHVRLVREGPHVTGANGNPQYRVSIYYGYLEQFDPLVGPPEEQRYMEVAWRNLDHLEERAREQQRIYGEAFRWKSLRDNLELNEFYEGEDLIRLNVHYRFLSAFVHLTPTAYRILHRRPNAIIPYRERYREHVAEELGHLYAAALASREIDIFLRVTDEHPVAGLQRRDDLAAAATEARRVSQHLWFPGDPPHAYDRWRIEEWRSWRRDDEPTAGEVGVDEPYYRNPFERLVQVHAPQSGQEGSYEPVFPPS